jgi:2-polyprenyl-6-methoxyphenol hydroxylase-like FAD-dependent oxidoreductase
MASLQLHVAVIGGGIGGLSAAIALKRAGHSVTVFEQATQLHEVSPLCTIINKVEKRGMIKISVQIS